jgi:hypothetical protein
MNIDYVPPRKHFSVTNIIALMPFKEIISVYSEKSINPQIQNPGLLIVQAHDAYFRWALKD